ncbi:MAG: SDR family NAD(P)-dependent oxidoreductase [Hyphomonadaceae bacterium]
MTEHAPKAPLAVDVAIIGMAARFPGADGVDQFWANIRDGVESIRRLTDEQLQAAGVDAAAINDPDYVKACPVLDDVDKFDAAFFGLSARDASVMDPAHRIFLEVAWTAFEDAGYTALPEEGAVGVFAAAGAPLYMMENLRTNPDLMRSMGEFLVRHTGNDMNFLATRVSYEMDLRGPSMNVQTACSSSLVAVHLACQSLARGECTLALAGGSTVLVPQGQGYHFKEGEILSPDGHCRPFDAKSAGTVFGSGAGAIILKRLSDALDDGDTIHAVVRGSAINNDGAVKVSYLAPGVEGQAAVIASALQSAGVDADSISYVETHGTGTLVGDPIEVEALNEAFRSRTSRRGFCGIGSVKSNIGHLGEAAGAASLIKAVMALKHRQLPPSLGFETPNPAIDFANSPFYVNALLRPWTNEGVRRCGVTALGAGGTNCHIILEEAPAALVGEGGRSQQLLTLSARTRSALDAASINLADTLAANAAIDLADVAYTLAVGRRGMQHRRVIAAGTASEAAKLLRGEEPKRVVSGVSGEQRPKTVFMFPGGGAQYAGMGRELYEQEDVYRDAVDSCLDIINPALGLDLRSLMYPDAANVVSATRTLERPSLTLPSLFATEYALGRLFQSWGATPQALIGHSVGEYAAACLAGVVSLEDALKLVTMRGRLFEVVQRGGMLSVQLSEQELRTLMPRSLDVAAANAPDLSVASGPVEALKELEALLKARGVESTPVHIDVAAHSAMLDPVLEDFRKLCRTITFQRPQTPFISNVTGKWITDEQATSPDYWVTHLRSTVRFADGLATLRELGEVVLLEIGPGRTLSMLARAQSQPFQNAFSSLRHPQETASDLGFALTSLGRLWTVGADIDWSAFYDGQLRNRIPLPTYPFERQSYWVEPGKAVATPALANAGRHADVADWFHVVGYNEAPLVAHPHAARQRIWLVVAEHGADARRLAGALSPDRVVLATPGKAFGEQIDGTLRVNFGNPDDHAAMMQFMEELIGLPDHVVYLADRRSNCETSEEGIQKRFLPVTHLFQALGGLSSPMQVSIVVSGVTGAGGEAVQPMHSLVLGPTLVAPREFDHILTRCIDLPSGRLPSAVERRLAERLAEELRAETPDTIVALSPTRRWIRKTSPVPLPAPGGDASRALWARDNGAYLITGGLGGIGLEVAGHLARSKFVRLALLAREALPPENNWDEILAKNPSGRLADRITRVRELRQRGAEVMVVAADIGDRRAVSAAVGQVRAKFGRLNGVVHAAGVMDDAPMMTKTADAMRRVLAPKVAGTLALDAAITENLDFMILFSSVASGLGLPGQVDYTAANAFQDAFARARSARASGRTVVVNWNAWRDIGMAASAHRRETVGVEPTRPSRHPALDGYLETAGERTFVATFAGSSSWLLDEHVIKNGVPVLPGTGFVELARAAFAENLGAQPIELANLEFIAPFRVEDGQRRRLEISLTPEGNGSRFVMRPAGGDPIVTGEARTCREPWPADIDPRAIANRCMAREEAPRDRRLDQDFMTFGPRWANIHRTRYGHGEALVELALDDRFASDIGQYVLHPAMLDMATGGAQALIPGVDLKHDFYVPLGYGRVRVFGVMPARVFSHVRCLPDTGHGLAYFDVTLADANGQVFADISRFTMRRIEARSAFTATGASRTASPTRNDALADALRDGVKASEGLDALDRIMAQPNLVQVIASSVDVNAWNERLRVTRAAPMADDDDGRVEGFERLPGLPEYVAPSTGTERVLASIWSDLLGFKAVGMSDNFFDLGGNSLLGVRLFAAIRKKFSVSLPLATLFEAQTIADLAKLLADPNHDTPASGTGWSPLVRLKSGAAGHRPIFFIHGSRGNVLVFKAFADRVRAEQPVYALQAAGVDGKMEPDQTIEVMAERYLSAIRQVQPKGPYMFAGYSGGGVIAYEMARRLKAEGQETGLLMLVDTLEPSQMRRPVTMIDRLRNLHRVQARRYAELPQVLWKYRLRPGIRKLMGVQEHKMVRTPLEAASDAVDVAYKRAQWAYNTPEFKTDVVIIRAKDARMNFLRSGATLGWAPFVKGNIQTFDVDAEHDLIFTEPSLSQVLAAFNTCAPSLTDSLEAVLATAAANTPEIPPPVLLVDLEALPVELAQAL